MQTPGADKYKKPGTDKYKHLEQTNTNTWSRQIQTPVAAYLCCVNSLSMRKLAIPGTQETNARLLVTVWVEGDSTTGLDLWRTVMEL